MNRAARPRTAEITGKLKGLLFKTEGANVFAVLDGASVPRLLDALAEHRPEYVCLYRGELKPDLAAVAPYVVRLQPGARFTDWVVAEGWGNHWGVFARSYSGLRALRHHLRTLLTVYGPQGKPMLFRYYDPRVLRLYLPTCNAEELAAVFGPVESFLVEDEDERTLLDFSVESGELRPKRVALAEDTTTQTERLDAPTNPG